MDGRVSELVEWLVVWRSEWVVVGGSLCVIG